MSIFRKKKITGNPGNNGQGDINSIDNPSFHKIPDLKPANNMYGLDAIYAFLQNDYESRGYNDALVNPDESYRNDNVKLFLHDLMILIERTATYYETMLKEIDFHISSRGRAGLIDLVEELRMKKEVANGHLEKVRNIREEISAGKGSSERIVLSYQRGFMRGLSAISQSKLFNEKM